METTIQTKIYKINLLLFLALCLGVSSTLYAAQNDEIDDEKQPIADNVSNALHGIGSNTEKDKATIEPIWACSLCTFDNRIEDTKCVMCKTPNPEWVRHNKKQPTKNKLSSHSPINVKFVNDKVKLNAFYRFKVVFNNSACNMRHTYTSLQMIHNDIIKTYKVKGKRLVFPPKNISANYVKCGTQLELYIRSLFSIYHQTKHEDILGRLGIWICDICKILNSKNKPCIQCKREQVTINVRRRYNSYFDAFYDYWYAFPISVAYANDVSLSDLLDKAIAYINQEEEETAYIYFIKSIGGSSFVGKKVENKITSTDNLEWDKLVKQEITAWNKNQIIKKGLEIYIENRYHHTPKATKITCSYINDAHQAKYSGLDLALQCPIYRDAKKHYIINEEVFKHLHFYSHFLDEYKEKAVCRYGAACKSFARLEENENLVKDLSHIKIYRHPPRRNRHIQLGKNTHQFICNQNENDNEPLYKPTYQEKTNLLCILLDEVIDNGYKYDLCLTCKQNNECKHNVYQKNKNTLISIVDNKFNHPRYNKMKKPFHGSGYNPDALMLSLLLYTGGDCNYDMCKSQRDSDYLKWKIFDYCLWHAIHCLSQKEYGAYKLYSGLANIKIPTKNIMSGYFLSYTSTTIYKDIAKTFVGQQGMMIEIDQAARNAFICCDVSWISKFDANESEVLIARTPKSVEHPVNNFFVQILDDKLGVQTVLLTKRPSYDLACKDIILKISTIIGATSSGDSKFPADSVIPIFKQLVVGAKEVPYQARKRWNAFRYQQQQITINMEYMYKNYAVFMPLLFSSDPKLKNVLLLDKLVQLFRNVTEIICKNTDCIGSQYGKHGTFQGGYSAAIVSSKFILGVKGCLSKMDKQAKLTKIVIKTNRNEIKDECNLHATQFDELGWQIGKGNKTIVVTKEPYGVICKEAIRKVECMVSRSPLKDDEATSLDMSIFNKLILGAKDIPADMQRIWNKSRHQQQEIRIDMEYMYKHYAAFIPLLFDPKLKHVLLLDRIVQLCPNVTEIICTKTDCIGGKHDEYGDWKAEYSADIVNSTFMLGVKNRLSKIAKHAKLTRVVIQTSEYGDGIKDDCKLYATAFGVLGWQLGKGNKTIGLTKRSYDDCISKVSYMKHGEAPLYEATSLDVPIFNKLISGANDLPADVQQTWDELRHKQQSIRINMSSMYCYYKAFVHLLFDPKCKNLLLLDKIAKIFPNATEIRYEATDCIDFNWNRNTRKWGTYSPSIVNSNFILGVKERLSKMDKHAKLTKIMIKTYSKEIKDDCKLDATQFEALGWQIGKGSYTIGLTKAPYSDCISKISAMLQADSSSYEATSLDVSILNKLISRDKDVPTDIEYIWNEFREKQTRITIDMRYIYRYYSAFIPLFCSSNIKLKNLLLLDKIAKIFPSVTEIICTNTDCDGIYKNKESWEKGCYKYSSTIVSSNFMLGVKERLSKIAQHARLKKIIIQTEKNEIDAYCKLYAPRFGALGWQIDKGAYDNKWGAAKKHNQITLTRLQAPKASFTNGPPGSLDTNENKRNDQQPIDNEVFDID